MTSLVADAIRPPSAAAVRFREVQRSRWARWASMAAPLLFVLPPAARLVREGLTAYSIVDLVQLVVLVGVMLCFRRWTLVTELRGDVLRVGFTPARRQLVPLSAIRAVDVVPYYPAIDGGWGVRRGQALRIWLSAADFVLVGTQRPDELRRLLVGDA